MSPVTSDAVSAALCGVIENPRTGEQTELVSEWRYEWVPHRD